MNINQYTILTEPFHCIRDTLFIIIVDPDVFHANDEIIASKATPTFLCSLRKTRCAFGRVQ
jgi:hypothetical protein